MRGIEGSDDGGDGRGIAGGVRIGDSAAGANVFEGEVCSGIPPNVPRRLGIEGIFAIRERGNEFPY